MIRLFVSDVDGCLAEAYAPFDLERIHELARLVDKAGDIRRGGAGPSFSLCSGRPYPYVEAVTQVLALRVPVLFESGSGMFDPSDPYVRWHPAFTPDMSARMEAIQSWMQESLLPGTQMMTDFAKRTQAGVIGADSDEVRQKTTAVEEFVSSNHPDFRVFYTPVSIDVVAPGVTKLEGLQWLTESLGVSLQETAYIGDANGDIDALQAVGMAFAPRNATSEVKAVVHRVTSGAVLAGVLEAYRSVMTDMR